MNIDDRGSFTEFIRTKEHGQVSINISNPELRKVNTGIIQRMKSSWLLVVKV